MAARDGTRPAIAPNVTLYPGVMGSLLRPLTAFADRNWQIFVLGFLFGLGFDTASEVGLLAISASQASRGTPLATALLFPALFTSGMALLDTMDGVLMTRLYDWNFRVPTRTLHYNFGITFLSVMAAALIGGIEAGQLVAGDSAIARAAAGLAVFLDRRSAAIGTAMVLASVATLMCLLAARARGGFDRKR